MTELQNLGILRERGEASPVQRPSRAELLRLVAEAYERLEHESFPSILDIERRTLEDIRQISTDGTILEPAVNALNKVGVPTHPTVGGLMDVLDLSQDEIHRVACYCHSGTITGYGAAHCFKMFSATPNEC